MAEESVEFYNDKMQAEIYRKSYRETPYFVLWTQVIRLLKSVSNPNILEIGCGTGQFAEYLKDEGYNQYRGFDFSAEAIKIATARVPSFNFFVSDALSPNPYQEKHDTVICMEVLEHITNDLSVIRLLKEGTKVILTLPTFPAEGHVRWFNNERSIKSRFYTVIDIEYIIKINIWFVCAGTVKEFKPNVFQRIFKTREEPSLTAVIKRIKHYYMRFLK
jgi:2-polyprenyl-3-methyl-5-hydroxy-6-metoxy-1,4-benzoquinol methylase